MRILEIHHHELDRFLVLKDFSDEIAVTLRKQFFIWCIDTCQKPSVARHNDSFQVTDPLFYEIVLG